MFSVIERAWLYRVLVMTALACQVQVSGAQERLAPEVLAKAKAATVFITVGANREQRSGSGFLTIVKEGTGYIATNAHVLMDKEDGPRPKEVNCIFFSGTAKERKLVGSIASIDFKDDLALVQVQGDSFPEPIDSLKPAEVTETQTVFIIGFPFGELLAAREGGLNHTISRSSVSSIRTNRDGQVVIVQLDGGLNPGNSGGPVIDSTGKLVGVAVAKVKGSEIGFAIPGARATALLNPQNPRILIEPGAYDHKSQTVQVTVELHDPLGKIRELRAFATPFKGKFDPNRPPFTKDRSFWFDMSKAEGADLTSIKPVTAKYAGLHSRLEVEVPTQPRDTGHVVHVSIVDKDGQEEVYVSLPFSARIHTVPRGWSDAAVQREWQAHAFTPIAPAPLQEIDLLGKITQVIPAAGGKYLLFVLADPRQLVALDVATAELVFTHDLPPETFVAANREELFVGPIGKTFQVWSLDEFKRQADRPWNVRGEVQGISMGWNSTGPLLVLAKDQGALRFSLLDSRTLAPLELDAMHSRLSDGPQRSDTELILPEGDGWFPVKSIKDPGKLSLRTSGWGHDFCVWSQGQRGEPITYITQRGRWVGIRNDYDSRGVSGFYWPNPQGTLLHSTRGSLHWNHKEDWNADDAARQAMKFLESSGSIAMPSYHPDWFLSLNLAFRGGLPAGTAIARHRTDPNKMKRLPILTELSVDVSALSASLPLTLDQCVHWYPEAAVLITINARSSRITHRYLPIPTGNDPQRRGVAKTPDEAATDARAHQQRLDDFAKKLKLTWPKVDALAAAEPMPARVAQIPGRVNVPGEIRDVVAAGGGRYLLIAEFKRPVVSVFDVTTCQIVKELPCPADGLVCGGREDIVLIAPTLQRWERWSLSDLSRRAAGEISLPGKILRAAMGAASTGPLMVTFEQPRKPASRLEATSRLESELHCALLSPADCKPIQVTAPGEASDLQLLRPANKSQEAIFAVPNGLGDGPLVAAANGKAFTSGRGPFLHLTVLPDGLIPVRTTLQQKILYAGPSGDGSLFLTSEKVFAKHGLEPCGNLYLLPTSHSQFALAIDSGKSASIHTAVVIDLLTGSRVANLPELNALDNADPTWGTMDRGQPVKRIHFIPQAKLLVTVPQRNDCLELVPVSLSCEVPTVSRAAAAVAASPPLPDTTLVHQGELLSWVPASLPKPSFEGQKTVPIPGDLASATITSSGRYLCLRFKDSTSIAIFDVCTATLVKRLEIDADARFAGYRDGLIVISPSRRTAELIRVPEGNVLASRTSDDWKGTIAVASGHHSLGPFAVLKEVGTQRQLRFYSHPQLEVISMTKSTLQPGDRNTAHLSLQANALTIANPAGRRELPQPFLRASALGNVFGYGDEFRSNRPFVMKAPSDSQLTISTSSSDGETVSPLADGQKIAFETGVFDFQLRASMFANCVLPAAEPGFVLADKGYTDADGWKLQSESNQVVVQELPGFGRKGMRVTETSKDGRRRFLRIPERLHVIPSLGVMTVIPNTNDRLIFERIPLALPSSALVQKVAPPGQPGQPTPEPPPPLDQARDWKDLAGKDVLKGAPLAKSPHMVRIRREDGVSVTVPVKRLSPADQAVVASLPTRASDE